MITRIIQSQHQLLGFLICSLAELVPDFYYAEALQADLMLSFNLIKSSHILERLLE